MFAAIRRAIFLNIISEGLRKVFTNSWEENSLPPAGA
jgi:hypothetical protein